MMKHFVPKIGEISQDQSKEVRNRIHNKDFDKNIITNKTLQITVD